jgi:phage terminase small subunit
MNDEELAEFARLYGVLSRKGLADQTDPGIVVLAAQTHGQLLRAYESLGDSLVITAPNGVIMAHPMLAVISRCVARLRGLMNDMRLTPKSAPKGGAGGEQRGEDNPWSELLSIVPLPETAENEAAEG